MEAEFLSLGFKKSFFVKGMRSIAGQFTKHNRCGVYILHFSNGQYYVGLAVDVVNRYAQHQLKHADIEYLSFKEVAKEKLAAIEKDTIHKLEDLSKPLRNISLVSIVLGETDLDLVVGKEAQEKWLCGETELEELQAERFNYPELRGKYLKKFEKLSKHSLFDEIQNSLRLYVLGTIPYPQKTEYSFWSLSCLPATHAKTLARVNLNWQETFVLSEYQLEEDFQTADEKIGIDVSIWLAKSVLAKSWTEEELRQAFPTLSFEDWKHESGGQDQQCVRIENSEFVEFMFSENVMESAKVFNLRLMRKGGCIWNRYHCFHLADAALDMSDFV